MIKKRRIIVSAGGTGGHIIPALEICLELQKNNFEVYYIGNKDSLEEKIIMNNKIRFFGIEVQKLYREITLQHLKFPYKLIRSIIQCIVILNKIKPCCVIGTGGFVSGPVGIASIFCKTPLFLQEQNSYPGITSKFLGLFAKKIYLGYKIARIYFKEEKTLYTGNPISMKLLQSDEVINFEDYQLSKDSLKLLIIGGSQGSEFINNLVLKNIDFLLNLGIELIWQTGVKQLNEIRKKTNDRKGIYLFDFTSEMYKIYNSVDLAISRAGALILAELEVKKIPSLIIPLPSAAGNHQLRNAKEFQLKGFGHVLEQKNIQNFQRIFSLFYECAEEKKEKFKHSNHLEASSNVVSDIIKELKLN